MRNKFITDINSEEERYKNNDNKIRESIRKIKEAKEEIQSIMASGIFIRLFKRGRIHALEGQLKYLENQNNSISLEQPKFLNQISNLKVKLKKVEDSLDEFAPEIRNLNVSDLKARIDTYANELESLKRRALDLERAIEEAPQTVLTNA